MGSKSRQCQRFVQIQLAGFVGAADARTKGTEWGHYLNRIEADFVGFAETRLRPGTASAEQFRAGLSDTGWNVKLHNMEKDSKIHLHDRRPRHYSIRKMVHSTQTYSTSMSMEPLNKRYIYF